ncbi:MAG: LysR family transcriptional regulator [Oceanicaulis sp.]
MTPTDRLDLDAVRAFAAVARTGSFTRAAESLFRSQSAVSLQIRKLEHILGERLFRRSARKVALTPAGERLMSYADRMLALHDEAVAAFRDVAVSGLVRLGTPEDFATAHLPRALAGFAEAHPGVQLEVTCDLTLNLQTMFHDGALDVALVKREPSASGGGQRVWSEALVWVGRDTAAFEPRAVTPLVVSPEPCVYRKRGVEALAREGRRGRASYVCGSLAGCLAAVRAGLGVAVLPRGLAPDDLAIDAGLSMPRLADAEVVLLTAADAGLPARRLADHIARALEEERGAQAA